MRKRVDGKSGRTNVGSKTARTVSTKAGEDLKWSVRRREQFTAMLSSVPERFRSPELAQVLAKAMTNSAFKKALLADPSGVFKRYGVPMPRGASVGCFENTPRHIVIVIPGIADPSDLGGFDLTPGMLRSGPASFMRDDARDPKTADPKNAGKGPFGRSDSDVSTAGDYNKDN